jgi:serine protease Do
MKRNVIAWAALAVSTAALVSSQNLTRQVPAAPKMPVESQKTARALSDAFASVAEYAKPSVVQISVQQKMGNSPRGLGNGRGLPPGMPRGGVPKDLEDFLREMQKRFSPEGGPEHQQFGGIAQGTGSGFVYDDQGHILTNNHVVSNAGKIVVKFHDGVEAPARVIGSDPQSDVAVIKVEYELPGPGQGQ